MEQCGIPACCKDCTELKCLHAIHGDLIKANTVLSSIQSMVDSIDKKTKVV